MAEACWQLCNRRANRIGKKNSDLRRMKERQVRKNCTRL